MGLRFGIRFNDAFGSVRDVVELARLSEQAGFDVIWYCHDLFLRDAWVTLTAITAATSTAQIGTCIVNPFTDDPAEIAMHATTLQEYSGVDLSWVSGRANPSSWSWWASGRSVP